MALKQCVRDKAGTPLPLSLSHRPQIVVDDKTFSFKMVLYYFFNETFYFIYTVCSIFSNHKNIKQFTFIEDQIYIFFLNHNAND